MPETSTVSAACQAKVSTEILPCSSASASILQQMLGLLKYRQVLFLLTSRDISARYRGSLLGRLWPLVHPLGQLLIYSFVFSIVLKIKFAESSSVGSFAIYFMAGLIPWSVFAESSSRSTTSILENPNLVSKVVFPLEVLPLVNVFSAFSTQFLASIILLIAATIYIGKIQATVLYLPLIVFALLSFSAGLSWFLASMGVFLRDTRHLVSLALQAGMYATPILYPAKSVPLEYKWVLLINPMAGIVEDFRRTLLEGLPPDWLRFVTYETVSILVALGGLWFFLKTKRSFADVM